MFRYLRQTRLSCQSTDALDHVMCRDADNRANTAAAREDGGEKAEQLPAAKKAGPGRKKAKESVDKALPITSFFTK